MSTWSVSSEKNPLFVYSTRTYKTKEIISLLEEKIIITEIFKGL